MHRKGKNPHHSSNFLVCCLHVLKRASHKEEPRYEGSFRQWCSAWITASVVWLLRCQARIWKREDQIPSLAWKLLGWPGASLPQPDLPHRIVVSTEVEGPLSFPINFPIHWRAKCLCLLTAWSQDQLCCANEQFKWHAPMVVPAPPPGYYAKYQGMFSYCCRLNTPSPIHRIMRPHVHKMQISCSVLPLWQGRERYKTCKPALSYPQPLVT